MRLTYTTNCCWQYPIHISSAKIHACEWHHNKRAKNREGPFLTPNKRQDFTLKTQTHNMLTMRCKRKPIIKPNNSVSMLRDWPGFHCHFWIEFRRREKEKVNGNRFLSHVWPRKGQSDSSAVSGLCLQTLN